MSDYTWMAWTLKIGDRAYTKVRPLKLEVRPQQEYHSTGYLWWKKEWWKKTGNWEIKFVYDMGPMTSRHSDIVVFEREVDARFWYDHTYTSVFLGRVDTPATPPPPKMKLPEKKKPNKPGLKLV